MAWIGTRSIPYTYDELPSAAATNHMIVALDIGDTTLFLDPTSQTSGFGVPSGFIQGKEALIAVDPEHHRVVEVPVMPASFSTVLDSIHGRLEGTSLVGTGVVSYTGYERYRLAEYLRATPVAKRTERMRSVLMKGSNAFQLDSCTITGLEDRDAPLVVRYAFRIPESSAFARAPSSSSPSTSPTHGNTCGCMRTASCPSNWTTGSANATWWTWNCRQESSARHPGTVHGPHPPIWTCG